MDENEVTELATNEAMYEMVDRVGARFCIDVVDSDGNSDRVEVVMSAPGRSRFDCEWVVSISHGQGEGYVMSTSPTAAGAQEGAEQMVESFLRDAIEEGSALYWAYTRQPVDVDLLFSPPDLSRSPSAKEATLRLRAS